MKKRTQTFRKRLLLICLALGCTHLLSSASPIEHIGDRYIIHVPELELNGEESLLEILMMCPEVMTFDGNNIVGGDPFANLYGKFVIRIDNQEYGLDYATLLHHFKAREIESIKICQNSEVMKGCSSLKKVIDISLRKGQNGVSGRAGLVGDTYGGGLAIASILSQQDKLRILSHVEGKLQRSSTNDKNEYVDASKTLINHYSHEGAKLNLVWTPTNKDILEVDAMQTYTRNHFSGVSSDFVRAYHLQADYTHTLSDNGTYMLLTMGAEHISDNGETPGADVQSTFYHNHSTYPFTSLEFSFPIATKDLWLTTGFEGGLSIEKNIAQDYTNHSNYQDIYAQIDYRIGRWAFMLGDRYRIINFKLKQIASLDHLKHTTHNHAYTISVINNLAPAHTLQGSFSRRLFNQDFGDFVTSGDMEGAWKPFYTTDISHRFAYVTELKHTYSKPSLVVATSIKNIHQKLSHEEKDNTLGVATSVFWHQGILRVTAGFNYFWEAETLCDTNNEDSANSYKRHSDFGIFKLAPQLTLAAGWRLRSNLIWCTHRRTSMPAYTPANLYAEASATKSFGKHWLLEVRYHDIASQHLGNRAATIGCTYYF